MAGHQEEVDEVWKARLMSSCDLAYSCKKGWDALDTIMCQGVFHTEKTTVVCSGESTQVSQAVAEGFS